MIGMLSGRVVHRGADHVLLEVHGVGYVVHVSRRTLAALPEPGAAVALHTDLLVREDLLQLFGFSTLAEREWFILLKSVQGVGAKAALAILSALGAEGVGRAIALGDWNAVKAAQGVGPKIAQRVVNELKDKAPAVMALDGGAAFAPASSAVPAGSPAADGAVLPPDGAPDGGARPSGAGGSPRAEALSALQNLGYQPAEAAAAVAGAAEEAPGADTAGLIRAALKLLAPKGSGEGSG